MNNKIDDSRMNEIEEKDYQTAKKIFNKIFSKYTVQFEKMKTGAVSDMRFQFMKKDGDVVKFNVEIKSRNQSLDDYDTLPLTVQKYCNLKDDTQDWERLIYISLVNDEEYFIFDLDKLDWNKVDCHNWYINKVEYSVNGSQKVKTPTFFLPVSQCVYNGLIS